MPAGPVQPGHLVIPAIGVDAQVVDETVKNGALVIPGEVADVGRWVDGAPLGSPNGTVLLAGHIDNINQGAGALHDLVYVRPGDRVYLNEGGVTTTWAIDSLQQMSKAALPRDVFDGPSGPRRLAVVTCAGQVTNGEYDDNAVVEAVPVP